MGRRTLESEWVINHILFRKKCGTDWYLTNFSKIELLVVQFTIVKKKKIIVHFLNIFLQFLISEVEATGKLQTN